MTKSNGAAANATATAHPEQQLEIKTAEADLQRLQMAINTRIRSLGGLGLSGITHEGERETWKVFGWPQRLSYEDFFKQYKRGLGGRIVNLPASDTWKKPPTISEDGAKDTQFINETNALVKRLSLWSRFMQVDKLSGIGQFAILLIGLRDTDKDDSKKSSDLSQPVNADSINSSADVLYLRPYPQNAVTEIILDTDLSSPRFSLPKEYRIQTGTETSITSSDQTSMTTITEIDNVENNLVHWSRVLHVVREPVTNDVLGEPSLERPFNTLTGLYSTSGSSVEAFWQVVWGGLAFTTKEGYKMDDEDLAALETEIDEYQNQWRRYMRLQGIDVQNLGTEGVDPSGLMGALAQLLAGESNIPLRILLGSERGELASSQDERNWAGQISARQTSFAEPLTRDFLDRLIEFGALTPPVDGSYDLGNKNPDGTFDWPSIFEQSELEKAETASNRAASLKTSQEAKMFGAGVTGDEIRGYGGLPPSEDDDDGLEPLLPDDIVDGGGDDE